MPEASNPTMESIMLQLATHLNYTLNKEAKTSPKFVFTLLVAKSGENSRADYISNADRESAIHMLKAVLAELSPAVH